MLRIGSLMRLAAFASVIVLIVAETGEAQRREQGRQRQRGRGRFGVSRFGGGGVSLLKNKYLQGELNLTAAQKKRIAEIDLQLTGSRALQREDVQTALGITESQKKRLAEANKANDKKRRELFGNLFRRGGGNPRPNREELMKKFQKLRTSGDQAIFAVLTASQKRKFEQMKGKPIDREKLLRRPAPRRRRPEL